MLTIKSELTKFTLPSGHSSSIAVYRNDSPYRGNAFTYERLPVFLSEGYINNGFLEHSF